MRRALSARLRFSRPLRRIRLRWSSRRSSKVRASPSWSISLLVHGDIGLVRLLRPTTVTAPFGARRWRPAACGRQLRHGGSRRLRRWRACRIRNSRSISRRWRRTRRLRGQCSGSRRWPTFATGGGSLRRQVQNSAAFTPGRFRPLISPRIPRSLRIVAHPWMPWSVEIFPGRGRPRNVGASPLWPFSCATSRSAPSKSRAVRCQS